MQALKNVSLRLQEGEILALVGENGAGKSTLMKIVSGSYTHGSFSGEILLGNESQAFTNPLDAEAAGIAIIHQELSPFQHLSVAENLFVGHWPNQAGLVKWKKLEQEAAHWLGLVGLTVPLDAKMAELSVGSQQLVEIAKALARNTKILILDEPTSALTAQETETLFSLLRKLRSEGKGLIYISHKMEEIYQLADRIHVLRDGESIIETSAAELPEQALLEKMVGRPLHRLFPEVPVRHFGKEVLRVDHLTGKHRTGRGKFGPVSFSLRKGEILGFAGLLGAGRTEILQSLFGDREFHTTGNIFLHGVQSSLPSPMSALQEKLTLIPEDRKRDSILPTRNLLENISLSRLSSGGLFRRQRSQEENRLAKNSLENFGTKYCSATQLITELSGGNQQKVIFGRALQTNPDIILLDEPTRGIDVGAKYEIYEILFRLASEGKSFLLVSSDLLELMALSDRMLVMAQGKVTGSFERKDFKQTDIMRLALASGKTQ